MHSSHIHLSPAVINSRNKFRLRQWWFHRVPSPLNLYAISIDPSFFLILWCTDRSWEVDEGSLWEIQWGNWHRWKGSDGVRKDIATTSLSLADLDASNNGGYRANGGRWRWGRGDRHHTYNEKSEGAMEIAQRSRGEGTRWNRHYHQRRLTYELIVIGDRWRWGQASHCSCFKVVFVCK